MKRPDENDINLANSALQSMGALLEVARKPHTRWVTMRSNICTLAEALELVKQELRRDSHPEYAIFTQHATYGGIIIWTSKYPDVVNVLEFD